MRKIRPSWGDLASIVQGPDRTRVAWPGLYGHLDWYIRNGGGGGGGWRGLLIEAKG